MTPEIIFSFGVSSVVIGTFIWLTFFGPRSHARKMVRSGRAIDWSEALRATRAKEGMFTIYLRKLWWIKGLTTRSAVEAYVAVEDRGKLVVGCPKGDLKGVLMTQGVVDYVSIDVIPFVDPAPKPKSERID